MQLMKHSPWSLLRDIREEVNKLFDRDLMPTGSEWWGEVARSWTPRADVKEVGDKFVILAELPGVSPKDIQISIENNKVCVKGERMLERHATEEHYSKTERMSGTFYRQFNLPDYLNSEKALAKMRQGILEIIIPKKESYVPKKLEVQVEEE